MKKIEKINKCREILHKNKSGEKITDYHDLIFLQSIFETHSEWDSKKGVGIDYLTTRLSPYKNKCFFLHRIDGTITDISFTKSITKPSKISQIKDACRVSITKIIFDFRNKNVVFGKTKCPFTGNVLTAKTTHIDHYNLSFNDLFKQWLKTKDEAYLFSKINKTKDNSFNTFFIDEEINKDFVKFHNSNTNLRAVSQFANLSILNKR